MTGRPPPRAPLLSPPGPPPARWVPVVIVYRRFKNTDPPGLVEVWNAAATGRGTYPLRTPGLLERWVFSKPYFDPDGLVVAEDSGRVVGFALAGFGPTDALAALDPAAGVVCAVLVHPDHRRHGIGRELLRRAEDYLRAKGTAAPRVGAAVPANPFLFGLYGGSNSPGVLESDAAGPFLQAAGYQPGPRRRVFQKSLDAPPAVADPRFAALRRRFDMQLALRGAAAGSWWGECVWGCLDPSELRVVDRVSKQVAARAVLWELEGYGWRWGRPAAGILDVRVRPDLRRQGVAKLALLDILRFLQEQFFGVAEMHVPAGDPAGEGLCRSLGFEPVDEGVVWTRDGAGGG